MARNDVAKRVVVSVLLAVLTVTFLYPLYYMLINSLKTRTAYFTNPFSFPAAPLQWENFATMVSQFRILNLFKNSLLVSAGT
ncbi:MAG TPA: carbohydrate ABC transporter permease, partial [Spirochaetia bacterium]